MKDRLHTQTLKAIRRLFDRLDYHQLGPVYCYEGGEEFWRAKREPCRRLGTNIAEALVRKLSSGGRSLYVGAGVAELPCLMAESLELHRQVEPYNLRRAEVTILNHACQGSGITFRARTAETAQGLFDHLWIVSVLNDPERFPDLSALSYGNANPITFNSVRFERQRRTALSIVNRCLAKLSLPALVTTSIEEVVWIADWCHRHRVRYHVERKYYPTALVGDPVCFIRLSQVFGERGKEKFSLHHKPGRP
ncbi:MAG: hypothetical protein NNA31_08155 [Nitrospira sp.]|nr:hypothetical protein [Nitrospira sp.]